MSTGEIWALSLDHPLRPEPRWGFGRPVHPELDRLAGTARARCLETLQRCSAHLDRFAAIGRDYAGETEPYWGCGWLSPLDLMVLYSMVVEHRPRLYLEVGSGCSTTFVRRAVRDHGLATRILSIDPEPRALIDDVCDTVVRQPLEQVGAELFDELEAGDVLFIDGSHRCFTNSDATVAVLEILPRLRPGVVVGFDDIYLPHDYPPHWQDRFYSEQYLLGAWLLGGAPVDIICPLFWAVNDQAIAPVVDDLLDHPSFSGLATDANGFWMQIRAGI